MEALGGGTQTSLSKAEIEHHLSEEGEGPQSGKADDGRVLSHLLTRWSVKDAAARGQAPRTEVDLAIEFQFANPLYSAMSSAVADKVAGYMIEAFEKRVREVMAREQ